MYRSDFARCPLDGGELVITVSDPLIGVTIAEHYTVESLIGEGAMGRVYRTHHVRLVNKRFAIKILLGDLVASAAMRIRFAKEAENASRLDHQNIVGVVDFGRTEAGLMYIVMELVEGPTLGRLVHQGPMPAARVKRLARQLCAGLAHAHDRGVVHRDFKPDNILIVDEGAQELACIADFGLAISVFDEDARLTSSGVMCTPAYAAPEQLIGADIDRRADLYALGVTLFEMLTGGVMPFGSDPKAVVSRKLTGPPAQLRPIAPHASMELASVIERLIAREPADRFQTAHEVLAALDVASPADTIELRTPPRRGARWPFIAALVVAASLALVTFAIDVPQATNDPSLPPLTAPATARLSSRNVANDLSSLTLEAPPPPPPPPRITTRPRPPAAASPGSSSSEVEVEAPAPPSPPPEEAPAPPPPVVPPPETPKPPASPPPSPPPIARPTVLDVQRASARITGLDVEGGLSYSVVRRAIERLLPGIAACARGGTVDVQFTIEERRVDVLSADGAGGACASSVLRRIRTEAAPDVGAAVIRVRIGFGGGS